MNIFHRWVDSLVICRGIVGLVHFFVRNDWGLVEKWGKMKDLLAPLHIEEEDILRILKVPDIEHLLYEVHYLNKYIEEELLFRVGLSFHTGRSDARMLKMSSKVLEPPVLAPKIDRLQIDLVEAQAMITQLLKDQKAFVEKVVVLEAENKSLEGGHFIWLRIFESHRRLQVVYNFEDHHPGSYSRARDHIYDALEQQCINEGFIWGFLKGVCLVQQKTGLRVACLTPSQASNDSPIDSDGAKVESELQKSFTLEKDDEIVEIECQASEDESKAIKTIQNTLELLNRNHEFDPAICFPVWLNRSLWFKTELDQTAPILH
ncbi:hypothetical protein IEQ34_003638 [Dendrobium chrysotoxum]|uniref:Uncharacterized protein n=1 Tax=Dendrobium chrysotoxum TaxID=161865 RepID=A0AAV7HG69_DENCH|nr:hypothetical protein IEQ34_003638 [Dendrobium chrysotoxum]